MLFGFITANMLLSLAITAASVAYQRRKAKKLAAEMDKRKEVRFAYNGEPFYLGIPYGRVALAGGKVLHKLSDSYFYAEPPGVSVREPSTGSNYSLTSPAFYAKKVKLSTGTTGGVFHLTSVETSYNIEIYWDDVLVYTAPGNVNVKPTVDDYTYTIDELVAADSDPNDGPVGSEYFHRVHRNSGLEAVVFNSGMGGDISGSKKEFLLVQQAVCFSGINQVIDVEVDDKNWNDDKLKHGQRIHFYKDGGVADPMATANGALITNTFTDTAYASMVFRLNRDEYNYSGSPNVVFYIEGMKVYDIVESGGSYSLSAEKIYTNNPALVLLDYLMSDRYGRGLTLAQIDLETFGKAKDVCNRIVRDSVAIDGRVNGRRPDVEQEDGSIVTLPALPNRELPLYECNSVIDSERTIRENIELILDSMPGSDLIWSGGVYKLSLNVPRTEEELEGMILADITADDIVNDQIDLSWPDSSNRFNQAVVRFKNEFENFSDDTATWPAAYSDTYLAYLTEDSGKLLKTELYLPTISDPYHAIAKAEEIVRSSRSAMTAKLKIGKKGILLEPGDIVRVTIPSSGLLNEIMRVEAVAASADMTASLELIQFSLENFAWNVGDDIPYLDKIIYYNSIPRPTDVTFTAADLSSELFNSSSGRIDWVEPNDATISDYIIDASLDGGLTWSPLGTTANNYFYLPALTTGTYRFSVRSRQSFSYSSARALAADGVIVDFGIFSEISTIAIYADNSNPATNDQSLERRLSDRWYATYTFIGAGDPTLPITSGITFFPWPAREAGLVFYEPYMLDADDDLDINTVVAEAQYESSLGMKLWYPIVGDYLMWYIPETNETVIFILTGYVASPQEFTWSRLVIEGIVSGNGLGAARTGVFYTVENGTVDFLTRYYANTGAAPEVVVDRSNAWVQAECTRIFRGSAPYDKVTPYTSGPNFFDNFDYWFYGTHPAGGNPLTSWWRLTAHYYSDQNSWDWDWSDQPVGPSPLTSNPGVYYEGS